MGWRNFLKFSRSSYRKLDFFFGLKGVHNGRTMLSYIQEHIVCSWKQFESAWKSIWVLRYCKKYDVLFLLFRPSLGVPVSISETSPWPVKHCDEIVITGSGPSLCASALSLDYRVVGGAEFEQPISWLARPSEVITIASQWVEGIS